MRLSKAASALPLLAVASSSLLLLSGSAEAAVDPLTAPNVIIMQPDDLQFYEDWTPPAHIQTKGQAQQYPPNSDLPNMNRLRLDGVEMKRAYTASPKCGTSRYSTMTGRYASRSSFSRVHDANDGMTVSQVEIPTTKLQDEATPTNDGEDCKTGNLAAAFQEQGYRTGVVGKWHLLATRRTWGYTDIQERIRQCGFDSAEAIYKENLGAWTQDEFHHNMEYVASRAVKFIDETPTGPNRVPFFLYANPTVPHGPNVEEAILNYDCTNTPEGNLTSSDVVHSVHGMTAAYGGNCTAYRESILDRAGSSRENKDLGSIWADDAIGAIIDALERKGELDNTFFLYQMDHGQEGKDTVWEQGMRIAQFVHFPDGGFSAQALSQGFSGVVSTIDVGPTVLDYAGVVQGDLGTYDMDGTSWKSAIQSGADFGSEDRCVVGEIDRDRAVVCGCDKYMRIYNVTDDSKGTANLGVNANFNLAWDQEMLFDMCGGTGSDYVTSPGTNPEETNEFVDRPVRAAQLSAVMDCHLAKTDPTRAAGPDYSACAMPVAPPTPSPTASPTTSPTAAPTASPVTSAPTSAPVAADIDDPDVTGRVPPENLLLGDVSSYGFAAVVTDQSALQFVRFNVRRVDTQAAVGVGTVTPTLIDAGSGLYAADFDFNGETGSLEWRVDTRDVEGNRIRTDWFAFTVGNDPATVITAIRNEIEEVIAADPPIAAKFIRMGFHDAVGTADGCIDMTNGDNAGLDAPIAALDPIVATYENADISRADIWAIATLIAADVSLPNNQQGRFPLKYIGRANCEDRSDPCPVSCDATNGPDRHLPSPDLTTHEILDFFDVAFGFNAQETVALMGAHTLGKMARTNSGFDGQWVNNELELNNAYYGALVGGSSPNATEAELIDGPGWAQESVDNSALGTPSRTQWVHVRGSDGAITVMTNSDLALVRDMNDGIDPDYLDETTGVSTCRFKGGGGRNSLPRCPAAQATLRLMAEYKHDNDMWVDDFEDVMDRMMREGYSVPANCADPVCVLDSATTGRRLRGGGK